MTIKELIAQNEDYIIEMRREFHMHPELSYQEERTSRRICEELEKMNIQYEVVGRRNVIGIINKNKAGKKIAIRADIDALPVCEEVDLPFKSQTPGVMHACGHDGHTAMLLGIAKSLNELKDELNGSVYLCFQVAEEVGGGAAEECVEYLQAHGGVDQAIGTHLMAQMPVGLIGIPDGAMMAGNTGFKIKVHGVGGHGSRPDLAVDPIRPACDILLKVQAIPVNRHDPFSTVVVSPCMINAGTKNNIIPNDAEIEGNLRFFKAGEDIEVIDLMRKIAENVAAAYGCTAEVERVVMAPLPVVNDKEAAAAGRALAAEQGLTVLPQGDPATGSDDYAAFVHAFKGFYCVVGAKSDLPGTSGNHHNANFAIDEASLKVGATFMGEYAYNFLTK
ncbi:amidohydrolase [Acetanaerobacterium sp. MSJ-12]|uniref:Amidohydrolase n=1 Tax=Bittarella massiliensis (ex Durand et al. 2017) TaxID=1720313 RepID=A0AAW5K8T5_9FIRM|nr:MULTISPECIES: amidohydrolase [Oscillospiraceae]MBC2871011.1 amidohydrolase [Bittarella massiliensis (ex Durand et al. 2017)]MBU5418693.1 amidohydrolase [Acetanaerobacterium sp. MSJ-12]MCQ4948432.1 amidohydrolase [Bittarella massiliensis (ex Durand et al. 2017)]